MAEKDSKRFKLPSDLNKWKSERNRLNCEDMDIHNLEAVKSASEIETKQFLTLKVFWTTEKLSRMVFYLEQIGFDKQLFDDKGDEMRTRAAWTLYIQALTDNKEAEKNKETPRWTRNSIFSDELGGFQLVLHNQFELVRLEEDKGAYSGSTKVAVTPTRENKFAGRLRTSKSKPSYKDVSPETPQRQSVLNVLTEMSAKKNDYGEKFDDAEDEQLVNNALVNLLNLLWIDEKRNSEWTMTRKEFKYHSQCAGASFVARTDGHLQVGNKSGAILEVKARARRQKVYGDHKIEIQESAQMALWIAQEPHSHWAAPEKPDAKGKEKAENNFQ